MTASLVSLADPAAADAALAGRKAARLAQLAAAGYPVPAGFVIPTSVCRALRAPATFPADLRDELRAALAALGGPVAVRSSGCAEDLDDASFAGLYETVLDVRDPAGLEAAIGVCLASVDAPRVQAYLASTGVHTADLAVLVQRMVPARAAGVAFTADPLTGERDVTTVSAVRGTGDKLVSGLVDAEEWRVRAEPQRHRGAVTVLEPGEAARVADLARRVGGDAPVDIEWALTGDGPSAQLHLLQARPMTALPEPVRWEAPAPGFFARNLRIGEWLGTPVTPLFASWCIPAMERRMADHTRALMGFTLDEPYHVILNGWYYMGMNLTLGPLAVVRTLAHVLWTLPRRWRDYLILIPPLGHVAFPHELARWRDELLPRYRATVVAAERALASAPVGELLAHVANIVEEAATQMNSVTTLAGFAGKAEWALQSFLTKHLPKRDVGVVDLVVGARHVPAAHDVEGIDWYLPTLGERGALPPALAEDRFATAMKRRDEALARTEAALPAKRRPQLRSLVDRACAAHAARVEQTGLLTLGWPVLRGLLGRIGDHLVATGRIARRDDVHFLRRDELQAQLAAGVPIAGLDLRRADWDRQRRLCPPLELGTLSATADKGYGALVRAFRHPEADEPGVLPGMAASAGRVSGTARVVRSVDELDHLAQGEILVAPVTTPLWTLAFGRAAAIVTDSGSLASHASVVAREHGIPAVVGTGEATARIADGQWITVDGTRGVVRLDGAGQAPR